MIKNKLGFSEAVAVLLSVLLAHSISSLPRTILNNTKSGTIINLIFITFIAYFIFRIICKLLNCFQGKDILDIAEYLGGSFFKNIIGSFFICYFIFSSCILLRNFSECLKLVYFPMTNIFFIVLLFVISLMISGRSRLSSLSKIALLITPISIISTLFIFSSNIQNFNFTNMYPILGDGYYSTFITGLTNLSAFGAISFIYFLPPYLKNPR